MVERSDCAEWVKVDQPGYGDRGLFTGEIGSWVGWSRSEESESGEFNRTGEQNPLTLSK